MTGPSSSGEDEEDSPATSPGRLSAKSPGAAFDISKRRALRMHGEQIRVDSVHDAEEGGGQQHERHPIWVRAMTSPRGGLGL